MLWLVEDEFGGAGKGMRMYKLLAAWSGAAQSNRVEGSGLEVVAFLNRVEVSRDKGPKKDAQML